MITEFYPIFKSEKAGINLFWAVDGLNEPWRQKRFWTCRLSIAFVWRAMEPTIIWLRPSVCGGKDFQDDWSRRGAPMRPRSPMTSKGRGNWFR